MAATYYILLNGQLPDPADASPGQTLPLLRWDDATTYRYALAMINDEANDLAEAVLVAAGFDPDPNNDPNGAWRYYAVNANGPLKPFNANDYISGLPPGAPTGGNDGQIVVVLPTSQLSVMKDLDDTNLYKKFQPGVFALKLSLAPTDSDPDQLAFRLVDPNSAMLAPWFVIEFAPDQAALDTSQGGAGQGVMLPDWVRLTIKQEPGAAGLLTANGLTVLDDGSGIVGLPDNPDGSPAADPNEPFHAWQLELGPLGLRSEFRVNNEPMSLAVEIDLDAVPPDDQDFNASPRPAVTPLQVPLSDAVGGTLAVDPTGLRARLGPGTKPALSLVVQHEARDSVDLTLQLQSGVVMHAAPGQESRPYLLPARDRIGGNPVPYPLQLGFVMSVPSWFRGAVADADFTPGHFAINYSNDLTQSIPDFVDVAVSAIAAAAAELGSLDAGLNDLLGNNQSSGDLVTFKLTTDLAAPTASFGITDGPTIAVGMVVTFPKASGLLQGSIRINLVLKFDFQTFRLASNQVPFLVGTPKDSDHFVDLGILAFQLPGRSDGPDGEPPLPADALSADGLLDFKNRELVLNAPPIGPATGEPGGFISNLEGITAFVPGKLAKGTIDPGVSERFRLVAKPFSPDDWPNPPAPQQQANILLRVGSRGLSVNLLGTQDEVAILDSPHVLMQQQAGRDGVSSELVAIDGTLRSGTFFARMPLPGVTDIVAQATVEIKQPQRGAAPHVKATLELESNGDGIKGELDIGFLKIVIEPRKTKFSLEWDDENLAWKASLPVDGTLSLADGLNAPELDDLKDDAAISVHNLDLLDLTSSTNPRLDLNLSDPVKFDLLGRLVTVELDGLSFSWTKGGDAELSCQQTLFSWNDPGTLEVSITTGPIALKFDSKGNVSFVLPTQLGIEVRMTDVLSFQGELAWVDKDGKRYFSAGGSLAVAGLPGVSGLVKLGNEAKRSGKSAGSYVFYAGVDVDIELFTGVNLKSFGGGVGYNNRVSGLDDNPDANTLISKIDLVYPESPEGWSFVDRDGTYFSIVAQIVLGSNPGGPGVVSAYIADAIFSVDNDGVAAAAVRIFLFSSLDFCRSLANRDHPVLKGAAVFNPRARALTVALDTSPDPAIELGDSMVAQALAGPLQASLRVTLTPQVADYYLEKFEYSTDLLDVTLTVRGSFRLAMFDDVLLVTASLDLSGSIDLPLGDNSGGFRFSGKIHASVDADGVASPSGLISYGAVDFSADFSVSAWVEVRVNLGFRKVSKRFSNDFGSLHIGVTGQGAFDEKGAFGMRGSASISVSILGQGLGMSQGFAYRDDILDRVSSQVDRYRARLDAIVNQGLVAPVSPLIAGGRHLKAARRLPRPELAAPPKETWMLISDGRIDTQLVRFGLLPAATSTWLAPLRTGNAGKEFKLQNDVRQIQVVYSDGGTSHTKTLYMPWLADGDPNLPYLPNGTLPASAGAIRDELRDVVLATADDVQIPAPAAPTSFLTDPRVRSASTAYLKDDVALVTPDGFLAFDFRDLSLLTDQEAEQDPLANDPNFAAARVFDQACAAAELLGRTRQEDRDDAEQSRACRAAFAALLLDELTRSQNPDRLCLLDPIPPDHQDTAVGLVFHLPQTATVTSVSVLRDGDTSFNEVNLLTRGGTAAIAQPVMDGVSQFTPRHQFRVLNQAGHAGAATQQQQEIGELEVRLPIDIDPALLDPGNPRIDTFQVFRQIGNGDHVLIAAGLRPMIVDFAGNDFPTPILKPYIYRDRLPVQDRALQVEGLESGVTVVTYSLRAAFPGEAVVPVGFQQQTDRWRRFPAIKLFVPPRDPFDFLLGIAFPANALFASVPPAARNGKPGFGTFLLVDLSTPEPTPARRHDGQLFAASDIELWAEELPLRQDRFLLGGEAERETSANASSASGRQSAPASRLQSIEGKFLVALSDDLATSGLVFADPARFQQGLGYRFYARPRSTANQPGALLAPLPMHLMARWPDPSARLRLRGADQFEVADWQSISTEQYLDLTDFTAEIAGNVADPFHLVRAAWESVSLLDGGVEVRWRDRDDPTLERRQLCEVLEESLFRTSRSDFGKASGWISVDNSDLQQSQLPQPGTPANQTIAGAFQADPDLDTVIKDLIDPQTGAGAQLLKVLDGATPFATVASDLAKWIAAFARYLISPLNPDGTPFRELDQNVSEATRLLVTGWMVPQNAPDNPLIAAAAKLRAQIKTIADLTDPPAGNDKIMAALDWRLSHQLTAILAHRLAIANELLGLKDPNSPIMGGDAKDVLPRMSRWTELRQDAINAVGGAANLSSDLPLTAVLLDQVWPGITASKYQPPFGSGNFIDQLIQAISSQITSSDNATIVPAIVPEGIGLRTVLADLSKSLDTNNAKLVRRARYQLQVQRDDTGKKVPVATPLETMLPDAWRIPESLQALKHEVASGARLASIDPAMVPRGTVAFFNILERLGFAVDVAVVSEDNQLYQQKDLLLAMHPFFTGAQVPNNHTVVVLAGQEPFGSLRPYADQLGYSFVKIAVVPDLFRLASQNNTIATWFATRAFGPADTSDENQQACMSVIDQFIQTLLIDGYPIVFVEPFGERWFALPSSGGRSESYWKLTDALGHVLDLSVRRVSRYESLLRFVGRAPKPADESTVPTRSLELFRVFPATGNDAAEPSLNPIPTTAYPHPQLVRFSYQIPSDGARSLLNSVSAARTGFRGTDLGFGYSIDDKPLGDDRSLAKVLASMAVTTPGLTSARGLKYTVLPVNRAARPQLFRGERLVSLRSLPYFYIYTLSARAAFQGRRIKDGGLTVLSQEYDNPRPAQRGPTGLGVLTPHLSTSQPQPGAPSTLNIEVFLSRNADMLQSDEVAGSPPALSVTFTPTTGNPLTLAIPDLPDLFTRYTLIYPLNVGDQNRIVYVQLASITLPWSPFYYNAQVQQVTSPVVEAIYDQASLPDANGNRSYTVAIEILPGTAPQVPTAYRVAFPLMIAANSKVLDDLSLLRLVQDRGGPESDDVPFEIEIGGAP